MSAYDVARVMKRDYRRDVLRGSLLVSLSSDLRFCWSGKGTYGLYRHRLVPGPRNLQGVGSLFMSAMTREVTLDALAFAMRWCGYRFQDFSLLNALRANAPIAAELRGFDATDARVWWLSVPSEPRMRRHLAIQGYVPYDQQIDGLLERCRGFIASAEAERQRRLSEAVVAKPDRVSDIAVNGQNYAPSGALTRVNYEATLAAARAHGRPWLDGSRKPIIHILGRGGAKWLTRDERDQLVAEARRVIFDKQGGATEDGQ